MSETELQKLIREEVEASEQHIDDAAPEDGNYSRPGREAAKVYSVRLAPDMVAELERVAADIDAPTSAVIRGFIADGLAARSSRTIGDVVRKLDADLRTLKTLVG